MLSKINKLDFRINSAFILCLFTILFISIYLIINRDNIHNPFVYTTKGRGAFILMIPASYLIGLFWINMNKNYFFIEFLKGALIGFFLISITTIFTLINFTTIKYLFLDDYLTLIKSFYTISFNLIYIIIFSFLFGLWRIILQYILSDIAEFKVPIYGHLYNFESLDKTIYSLNAIIPGWVIDNQSKIENNTILFKNKNIGLYFCLDLSNLNDVIFSVWWSPGINLKMLFSGPFYEFSSFELINKIKKSDFLKIEYIASNGH